VTGVSRSGTTSVAGVRAVAADASDAARVAELAVGADAVITATGPGTTAARARTPWAVLRDTGPPSPRTLETHIVKIANGAAPSP
jgi:hypothetical protein